MYYAWLRNLCIMTDKDENGLFLWNTETNKQLEGTYKNLVGNKAFSFQSKEFKLICRYHGEN